MKRIMVLATALLMSLAPAVCKAADDNYFVFVSPLLSHPTWLVAKEGFEQACEELGVEGEWVGPQGISAEEMAQLVDTAVAQGATGIITQSICPAEPINNAIENGVTVMMVDGDLEEVPDKLAFLGKDMYVEAELFYQETLKYIGEDEKIVLSIQCPALNNQFYIDNNEAVEAAFANHPGGFELVNITVSNGDKATGTNEWLNTFNTYPDVNVCVNLAAEAAPACVVAAEELGITDNLVILGCDDTEENVQYIKDGKMDGISIVSFRNFGYQASYWLYQHIEEGRVPEEKYNDAGTMMVNLDNLDTYQELLKVKVDLPENK